MSTGNATWSGKPLIWNQANKTNYGQTGIIVSVAAHPTRSDIGICCSGKTHILQKEPCFPALIFGGI